MIIVDEIGNRYGKWTILKRIEYSRRIHQTRWLCRCDCGTERIVLNQALHKGTSRSCGCLRREQIAEKMVGQRFGRLIVLERVGSTKYGNAIWLCKCDCGNQHKVSGNNLGTGSTRSCGCLRRKYASLPEGEVAFNALLARMKQHAKRRRHEWRLTKEQVRSLTQRLCYYCGAKPNQGSSYSGYNGVYLYNGLDRVDNNHGYTIDNVVPCCGICNVAKNDQTTEQFKTWIHRIHEHFCKNIYLKE